ncbi:YqjF family protein [Vampirovibrio chlorellavorus]|uniref:YqjF family protein n=1 Tax=Vampirovibrio chlorellavorus TaxID=758823 RepID=UPI0026ED1486|nr:DUF2071 domain-containing protein [Vampirovibrio chlorellavorus]
MIRLPFSFRQRWEHLLFLHYPVAPEVLQSRLPQELVPDTIDGQAWLSVVPFALTYWLPGLPIPFRFLELNLRTYVKPASAFAEMASGVYFFCLDANDFLSVEAARLSYHLNYQHARMQMCQSPSATSEAALIQFQSTRTDHRAKPARFKCQYKPQPAPPLGEEKASLQHWLTERYRLYTTDGRGGLFTARIAHLPWQWQAADYEIFTNELLIAHGFSESLSPITALASYCPSLDVVAHPGCRVKRRV